jgi:hypothetical protein
MSSARTVGAPSRNGNGRVSGGERLGAEITFGSGPGAGKPANEDLVVAVDGIADGVTMVLDGASIPTGTPACCQRDAGWYVRQLAAQLVVTLAADALLDLRTALAAAIFSADQAHAATCPATRRERDRLGPSAMVALTRQDGDRLDWLLLGDATLLIADDAVVACHSDRRIAAVGRELRARIRRQLRTGGGYTSPAHHDALTTLIQTERTLRNTAAGYWVAAADPAAAAHSLTGSCQIGHGPGEVRRFALLSDGAERAVGTFRLYGSWAALLDALAHDGPVATIAAVRAAEACDPDGRRYPRTRCSDDASALVGDFGPPAC